MNIDRIFTRDAIRVARNATLAEAAVLMRDRHVGALLVTDEAAPGRVIGIVTDRDLVIQAVAEGVAPRECAVGEVMTRALSTVQRGASLGEALEAMRKAGVRRLAVVEGIGDPIGIVSLDDILAALGGDLGAAAAVASAELEHEIARAANSAAISG
jgi:signal-transduction protein with cAMP-binding, CBS, and nucleotidyltransferase domain